MFLLPTVEDVVRVPPAAFSGARVEAVEAIVRAQYVDRVIDGLGLCVAVHSIEDIFGGPGGGNGGGYVHHGDGCAYYQARFRLVIFRPCPDETLEGWLCRADEDGLWVSTGFFTDIFVPSTLLPRSSEWDAERSGWVWKSADDEDGSVTPLDYDEGQRIRVKVTKALFQFAAANAARAAAEPRKDGKPKQPQHALQQQPEQQPHSDAQQQQQQQQRHEGDAPNPASQQQAVSTGSAADAAAKDSLSTARALGSRPSEMGCGQYVPPMVIMGRIDESGLGMCEWWGEE